MMLRIRFLFCFILLFLLFEQHDIFADLTLQIMKHIIAEHYDTIELLIIIL